MSADAGNAGGVLLFVGGIFTTVGVVIGYVIQGKSASKKTISDESVANRKISTDENTAMRTEYRSDIAVLRAEIKDTIQKNFDCEKREIANQKILARLELRLERVEQVMLECRHRMRPLIGIHPIFSELINEIDDILNGKVNDMLTIGMVETQIVVKDAEKSDSSSH